MDNKLKEFARAQGQSKTSLEAHLFMLISKFEDAYGVKCTDVDLRRMETPDGDSRLMSVKLTAEIK